MCWNTLPINPSKSKNNVFIWTWFTWSKKGSFKNEIETPLIPDIEIKYTIKEILENTDLEMKFILNLIQ